jgi:L,D-peptidoglycan transpeptidase YkuD (ErfK/YbiS/YcfS/YnhG family)
MNLIVTATQGSTRGNARLLERSFPCALGFAGIVSHKREGDKGTPDGCFPFRSVLYRADRVSCPTTALAAVSIDERDGWCDEPAHPAYNRKIRLPFAANHERLWREDHLYDIILIIGHNDAPVVPGAGSAVFVHLATPDFAPTLGCVAFREEDLRIILATACVADQIEIKTRP